MPPEEAAESKIVDLMEALKASVDGSGKRKPARRATKVAKPKAAKASGKTAKTNLAAIKAAPADSDENLRNQPDFGRLQEIQKEGGGNRVGDTVTFQRGSATYTGEVTERHPTQDDGAVLRVKTPEGKAFDVLERDVRCRSP